MAHSASAPGDLPLCFMACAGMRGLLSSRQSDAFGWQYELGLRSHMPSTADYQRGEDLQGKQTL